MKIIYSSYSEITVRLRIALHGLALGIICSLWGVFLLAVNTVALAWRKLADGIRRKPVAVVTVLLFILATSNLVLYASMKAKLTTAEWRYDRLRMHMDSVYEVYNIRNSYSRIESYER